MAVTAVCWPQLSTGTAARRGSRLGHRKAWRSCSGRWPTASGRRSRVGRAMTGDDDRDRCRLEMADALRSAVRAGAISEHHAIGHMMTACEVDRKTAAALIAARVV